MKLGKNQLLINGILFYEYRSSLFKILLFQKIFISLVRKSLLYNIYFQSFPSANFVCFFSLKMLLNILYIYFPILLSFKIIIN